MVISVHCRKKGNLNLTATTHVRDFSADLKMNFSMDEMEMRTKTGIKDFILSLDKYLYWYNEHRIKASLGYKSQVPYRQSLGIMN